MSGNDIVGSLSPVLLVGSLVGYWLYDLRRRRAIAKAEPRPRRLDVARLYVARGQEMLGPYDARQVRDYAKRGLLGAGDLVAPEGAPAWTPVPVFVQSIDAERSRGVYIILGLFFGLLGVHNFYAGRLRVGAWQVVFFILTAWTVVGALLELIFVIGELFTVTKDGHGKLLS